MRIIYLCLAIFFLLIFQAGILAPLRVFPVNLPLIMLVAAILVSDFNEAMTIALISGVFLDFSSGLHDGVLTLTFLAVFLSMYLVLHSLLDREPNRLVLYSSVLASTILYFMFFFLFNRIFGLFHLGQVLDLSNTLGQHLVLSLIFNFIASYPVFLLYSRLPKSEAAIFKPK